MKSDKKMIFAALAVVGGLLAIMAAMSYFGLKRDAGLTYLYYSLTCPHCKIVEEYMTANGTESKIRMVKKEISQSRANSQELIRRASSCGYKPDEVGVPFLWKDGKCLMGDQDIINYFKETDENK